MIREACSQEPIEDRVWEAANGIAKERGFCTDDSYYKHGRFYFGDDIITYPEASMRSSKKSVNVADHAELARKVDAEPEVVELSVPLSMKSSPLRGSCFICGEEIGACIWFVEIKSKETCLRAHEGCMSRAWNSKWCVTKNKIKKPLF